MHSLPGKKKKYSSNMVTSLINNGFLFIEKDVDNYLRYNMDTAEAFEKVRGKVRQSMRDFLRKEKKKKTVLSIPEICILEFQNEGHDFAGKELIYVFDAPLEPEIEQVLDNMLKDSFVEVGDSSNLAETDDKDMDMEEVSFSNLSFSDFPMMD